MGGKQKNDQESKLPLTGYQLAASIDEDKEPDEREAAISRYVESPVRILFSLISHRQSHSPPPSLPTITGNLLPTLHPKIS